jgi:hypothetical protein
MADDTDFVALYDELGLDAECGMADFKGAYRRRVAKLHPDHLGDPSTISRLQRLNRLYAAALEFERVHGRLPGATHRATIPISQAQATAQVPAANNPPSALPVAGNQINRRYVLLLLLMATVAFWLGKQPAPEPAQHKRRPAEELEPVVKPRQPIGYLHIGMGKDSVRSIQGQPFNNHDARWEYGPSWVEFRCDRVVDWYSSPLHPLRVQHADAGEDVGLADAKIEHC